MMESFFKQGKFVKSGGNRVIRTAFSFIIGFGSGFFISWIGAVLLTTVPHMVS